MISILFFKIFYLETFQSAKNENGNRQRLRYFKTDPLGDAFFFGFRVRLIFRHGRYKNKHILGKILDFIVFNGRC